MTKIDIISGFLGAGKTTFIKKMIAEVFQGERIVLIENEFGEVGVDGGFLKDSGIEVTEMNSGCICCSLVGDFARNLREVQERFHPERILIEPSGVGKLSDVMKSVTDLEAEQDVKLNGLITVVNTLKAMKQLRSFGEFFGNQIQHATILVLSRTQKATPEQLNEVVCAMRERNPEAAIITTPWDEIDGKQIYQLIEERRSLQEELMEEVRHRGHKHGHHHEHGEGCGCHECRQEHEEGHGHHHEHCHEHEEGHEHHHEHCHEHEEGHEHHHEHCHEHEEGHEHHHEHHHHHEHGEDCDCGCHEHHHEHHHDHHADEIFTSWGIETPQKFTREAIEHAMAAFCQGEEYGEVLRSKGMVPAEDGSWIYFDMVDGEYELRQGQPDYTGRIVVIGTDIKEDRMRELFGIA